MSLIKKGNVIIRTGLPTAALRMLINPPLIIRERCRLCGCPMEADEPVHIRKQGGFVEPFAHEACYKREVR